MANGELTGKSKLLRWLRFNGGACLTNVDRGLIRAGPEAARAETLPAGADARAAVSLQSCLCRLRENPVPRTYPQAGPDFAAMPRRCRRVRSPYGLNPRRRAADVSAYRRAGPRTGQTPQIRLLVHQRTAPEGEDRPVHTEQVFELLRAHGRTRG